MISDKCVLWFCRHPKTPDREWREHSLKASKSWKLCGLWEIHWKSRLSTNPWFFNLSVRQSATSVSNCQGLCSSCVANMKDAKISLFPSLLPHLPWWQGCYFKNLSFWLFYLPSVFLKWEDVLSSSFKAMTRAKNLPFLIVLTCSIEPTQLSNTYSLLF